MLQIGNAVPPPMGEAIGFEIRKCIGEVESKLTADAGSSWSGNSLSTFHFVQEHYCTASMYENKLLCTNTYSYKISFKNFIIAYSYQA